MKLCINCQHCIPPPDCFKGWDTAYNYAKCRLAVTHTSPVDGREFFRYCDLERDPYSERCGPDGKNWEAKP
jgi:hypothetical protein